MAVGPAATQAECVICFESLCDAPVAVLHQKTGQRACRHFFHRHCADACPVARGCPLCRADYDTVALVPELSYPEAWFETMRVTHKDFLTVEEVFHSIAATVAVSSSALEAMLPSLWLARGKDVQDPVLFDDLFGSEPLGLLWELQERLAFESAGLSNKAEETPAPDFMLDKRAWFEHWDTDRSGVLEREEVVRGLAKSFRSDVPAKLCRKRLRMRFLVDEMWPAVDFDGNDLITLDEFCQADGLADLILRNFTAIGSPRAGSPANASRRSPRGSENPCQGPMVVRRSGARASLQSSLGQLDQRESSRRVSKIHTWPEEQGRVADLDAISEVDDRPSLVSRPSLGFSTPKSTDSISFGVDRDRGVGSGSPTSSSGLPGATWSVVGRRRTLGDSQDSYAEADDTPGGSHSPKGEYEGSQMRMGRRLRSPLGTRGPRSGSPRNRRRHTKESASILKPPSSPTSSGYRVSFDTAVSFDRVAYNPFNTAPT